MFDCPEASQTSPAQTSVNRSVFDPCACPWMTSTCGPPAGIAASVMRQRPAASAFVVASRPASVARTVSSDAAVPHSRTGCPACTIM